MTRRSYLWGISLAVTISAVMVLSPWGQSMVATLGRDASGGLETIGYAFNAIFPGTVVTGSVPSGEILSVGLSLPLKDPSGLSHFIRSVSTPGSPEFRHFLTPTEFRDSYAPAAGSYSNLRDYFAGYGLDVVPASDRLMLTVSGTPSEVGAAFHTTFLNYRMADGQVFYGPAKAPQIPASLGVSAAFGFSNAFFNRPANLLHVPTQLAGSTPGALCPNGNGGGLSPYNPTQIQDAYGVNTLYAASHTGAGETVGIVDAYDSAETQTTLQSDLTTFSSSCGLPAPTVGYGYPVLSSTYNSSASSQWGGESVLDMDWVHSMAKGAAIEMTFSPNAGVGLYEAVNWLVTANVVNTISLSWGEPDVGIYGGATCTFQCNASTDGSYDMLHPVIEAAVAQGISVFAASGDCGAADGTAGVSTNYPASDEDATGVGGTTLTMSPPTGTTYGSESGWSGNLSGAACNNGGGAGGGWAPVPQPWYQSGTGVKNNGLRGAPDVGITAGSWLDVEYGGTMTGSAGTSDASPMWAALTAISDQIHGGNVGLINPALYAMLRSGSYSTYFHDITSGNNGYSAGVGWDPITGVGTPFAATAIPFVAGGGFNPTLNGLNATISASVTGGAAPLKVTFTAAATGGSGTYKLYDFNYGDSNATPTTSSSISYTYTVAGAYPANVVVYDSKGNSTESTYVLISVGTTPFTLGLSASSTTPAVGAVDTFTASPSGGTAPYLITYSYGDGTWLYQTSATTGKHTYAQAGVYCAQATATDSKKPAEGAISSVLTINVGSAIGTCSVSPPSVSAFSATPNPVVVNTATTFSVTVSGGTTPYTYVYTGLPAGCASSNTNSLSCTPTATGTFNVTVTVTDANSKTASKTTSLVVNAVSSPTITAFSASPNPVTVSTATTFSVTVSGGTTPYTYAYTGLPTGCTSSNTNSLSCTPTVTGAFNVTVTVTDANSKTASKTTSLVVNAVSSPTITAFSASPNPVTVNTVTTFSLTVSGGTTPYTYAYTGLPTGCTSSNTNNLSCTPTVTGTFNVTVTVTDANSKTASKTTALTVNPASVPTITAFSASPNPVTVNTATTLSVTVSGGTTPYSYAYTGLPTGCTSSNTNSLSCTPTATGTFNVTVTVTDANSKTASKSTTLTVNTASVPTITAFSASPNPDTVSTATTFSVTVSGGTTPYSYAYTGLPAGCTSSNTNSLSCTPTATGTFNVTVTVTDANSKTASKNTTLTVNSASVPTISTFAASPNPVTVNTATVFSVVVTGGTTPYSYAYTGLPAGCTSSNTNSLSCTPTATGTFSVTVTVTDANSKTATSTSSLIVNPASVPTIASFAASPNPVTVNTATSISVTVTGGTTPYSYAFGGLPTGCSTSNTNSLSCTPTVTGTFNVTVTVTDANSKTATKSLSLTVSPVSANGPTITSFTASPSSIPLGNTTTLSVSVSGGTPPYSYSYTNLPQGCASASKGALTCTPTQKGKFTVGVTVTDSLSLSSSSTTQVTVTAAVVPPPSIVSFAASPGTLTLGAATNLTVVASGGVLPLTYTYTGLPPGCATQNKSVFSCTPNATGTFTINVTVTDSQGRSAHSSTMLTVQASAPPGTNGLPLMDWLLIIGLVAVAALIGVVIIAGRRKPGVGNRPPPVQSWSNTNQNPAWSEQETPNAPQPMNPPPPPPLEENPAPIGPSL